MYKYLLIFTTAKKMDDFTQYSEHIINCVKQYNETSATSKNYKHIQEPVKITEENIELILESDNKLPTPLRALWLFSKLMLENEEVLKYSLGTRFLKPIIIKEITNTENSGGISDSEALKLLIDIYMTNPETAYMKKQNEAIKEGIKSLLEGYSLKKEGE